MHASGYDEDSARISQMIASERDADVLFGYEP
jgi:hypothetical protein